MGKNSDRSPSKEHEAAEWWVEFDSGQGFTQAQRKAWLDWSSRPENQRAYEEVAQTIVLLCTLRRTRTLRPSLRGVQKSPSTG
jgi:ferric-dicitrate binding protein FerR (iron transport regulator)